MPFVEIGFGSRIHERMEKLDQPNVRAITVLSYIAKTQYARTLWDTPGSPEDCKPAPSRPFRGAQVVQVVKFKIAPVAR